MSVLRIIGIGGATPSEDGKEVSFRLQGEEGEFSMTLPSPLVPRLISHAQTANLEALERYTGQEQKQPSESKGVVASIPNTISITPDLMGRLLLTIDYGRPTQVIYLLPQGFETTLAKMVLDLLKRQPDDKKLPS